MRNSISFEERLVDFSGKALNLLRMCHPNHFLFCLKESDVPRISISFSRKELRYVNLQCDMYVSRMRQIASRLTLTRHHQKQQKEQEKKELLETARRMAAQEIARLQVVQAIISLLLYHISSAEG